jgi:hypothetical protein
LITCFREPIAEVQISKEKARKIDLFMEWGIERRHDNSFIHHGATEANQEAEEEKLGVLSVGSVASW